MEPASAYVTPAFAGLFEKGKQIRFDAVGDPGATTSPTHKSTRTRQRLSSSPRCASCGYMKNEQKAQET
jgi:hypothetical protein